MSTLRVQPKEGNCANVHTIAVDKSGTVYASSREQRIIRVYDANGALLRTLEMPALVSGLHIDPSGQLWMTTGLDGQLMKVDRDWASSSPLPAGDMAKIPISSEKRISWPSMHEVHLIADRK